MSDPAPTTEELVILLKSLVKELAKDGKELLEAAPNLATPLRKLIELPVEKIDEAVDQLVASAPEDQRERFLVMFIASLEETKAAAEHTKWRIERRIQPEGVPRKKSEFKSFCKRKPGW